MHIVTLLPGSRKAVLPSSPRVVADVLLLCRHEILDDVRRQTFADDLGIEPLATPPHSMAWPVLIPRQSVFAEAAALAPYGRSRGVSTCRGPFASCCAGSIRSRLQARHLINGPVTNRLKPSDQRRSKNTGPPQAYFRSVVSGHNDVSSEAQAADVVRAAAVTPA